MPLYDYKCVRCGAVSEKIKPVAVRVVVCDQPKCIGAAHRLISAPAGFKVPDMITLNKKRQRIKEPMWRDLATGKLTPVNP